MKLTPPEIYEIMRDQLSMIRGARETGVMDPVQFYGFHPQEVDEIHFDKQGDGDGLWFRLNNGLVIDASGKPCDPDPALYDATPPRSL
jgi:hypothetical protein